jgi:hypothetical protein
MPRLDYSGGASCPALLLEPQRSNLSSYSEYFNGGIWIQSASSVTDNDATSPEGLTNAAKVVGDGTDTQIRLYDNYTFPSTGNYVLSVFAKAGNNDFIALAYKGVDGGITAYYDLSEGTTSDPTNGTIEAVGTDGWYRCSLTADLTGPDLTGNYNVYVARDETTTTFPSNGDANGKYVHIYGYQVEAGSYPTSYIPTYGSSVTRSDDFMNISSLADEIDGNSFTYFLEVNNEAVVRDASTGNISVGATGNRFFLYNSNTTSNRLQLFIQDSGGIEQYVLSADNVKIAIRFEPNNVEVFENGVSVLSTTQNLDFSANSAYVLRGTTREIGIKQTAIFPTALTDSECIALTTI